MKNIALELCYDGTAYHGWQIQKNAVTVQQTLADAITKVTGMPPMPELAGCGRTDAGVSAETYVASFRTDTVIPPDRLPFALHAALPPDISVRRAVPVPPGFHARFSCLKKEYVYRMYHSFLPIPGKRLTHAFCLRPFDVALMRQTAAIIEGKHDFSCFCASGSAVRDPVRTVFYCDVTGDAEQCEVKICADGFLYNMVRIIAGTLNAVSEGKMTPADVEALLVKGTRCHPGVTLPPCGLTLNRVWYGEQPGLDGIDAGVRQF